MQTQSTAIKLLHGDNTEILPTLAPRSVQTIVTSPPYFGLRDYGITPTAWPAVEFTPMPGLPSVTVPAQTVCLGLEADPLAYTAHLVHVFRLARPALADDGTAWLNLGDAYCSNGGARTYGSSDGALGRGPGIARRSGGAKPKDLLMIPARVAFALQDDGWYLRSDIVWNKPNCMPESVTDRPTRAHEYVFLLSKSPRYFYDATAIAEQSASDHPSGNGFKRAARVSYQNADGTPRGNDAQWQVTPTRNRRTVWTIPTQPYSGAHYAPMPEALVEPCILAGSKPGDTVLDMFFGSGTVGRVALKYGRACIGIDKNDSYISMSERRTDGVQIHMEAYLSPNESEAA